MLQALSTNLGETFRSVIASFRLSSLFPALCFVFLHHYCLLPYLANRGLTLLPVNEEAPLFLLLLTALISYILHYLNFPIIRWLEGYPMRGTFIGRGLTLWHKARLEWLNRQKKGVSSAEQRLIEDELGDYYPRSSTDVVPTVLGNVMVAFESYPDDQYGIDAVYMWPRILPILDKEGYAPFVNREKEGFDLFLNFGVLSAILAVELVILRMFLALYPNLVRYSSLSILTWSAVINGCVAYLFYRAAIANALSWGETVKAAFDLYRYDLAEQLNLTPFLDKDKEKIRWKSISLSLQGRGEFMNYHYPLPRKRKGKKN